MPENEVLVSIIILTYNQKDFIKECLDGILMQKTDFAFEILIGDDASEDGTSNIVEAYAIQYPKVIRLFVRKKNLGVTNNLYDLLKRAHGKYIANCEGDDYWTDTEKLKIQIEFLEKHSEYIGCTHDCIIVDKNGKAIENQKLNWICKKQEYRLQDFKGYRLPGQSATLVYRNFFLNPTHDYSIIFKANDMIADRTIILILVAQGKIFRMNQKMSCYRRVDSGITNRIFCGTAMANLVQYEFVCRLEEYVRKEFKSSVRFTYFKLEQLLKWYIKRII